MRGVAWLKGWPPFPQSCYRRRGAAPARTVALMDTPIASTAPYFPAGDVARELTSFVAHHNGAALDARPAVLDKLKELLRAARLEVARQLSVDGNGRRCAESLSAFQDELIRLVYDYTVANVYRATNPSKAERMAIVATGGYGRGLLAPFSDVDL